MSLIRCPKCDAICNSTDEVCHNCGYKLNTNNMEDSISIEPSSNSEKNITERLTDNRDERWAKELEAKTNSEAKMFQILAILTGLFFIASVFLTIFVKETHTLTYDFLGENRIHTYQTISYGWLTVTILSSFIFITFLSITIYIRRRRIHIRHVDGYTVMAYGHGGRWSLYIEGTISDSAEYYNTRWSRAPDDITLRGTLPNRQKILVTLHSYDNEFMTIEKIGETVKSND